MADAGQGPGAIERPALANETGDYWGSDVMALMLREIGLPYVALNPGASYRGLHDSLVNLLGNQAPQMLLCLHEEHAVAIAHGYAKVAGKPMGAIVHSNVGLMHATMAVFNAWCDRVPVILLGATGPVAADKRRPWIDWIHTAADQGALIRNYTKWDDQPNSVAAVPESVLRAYKMATTAPQGPVYVCFDAALQEQRIGDLPAAARRRPLQGPGAGGARPGRARRRRRAAQQGRAPGRHGRPLHPERGGLGAPCPARRGARRHRADRPQDRLRLPDRAPLARPARRQPAEPRGARPCCARPTSILSLDWVDLGGALKTACG